MGREITVDADQFALGIKELLGDIPDACDDALFKAVRQSTRKTAKALRSGEFGSGGKHAWSGEYMSGFSSRTRKGEDIVGEVGNKNKPGLVHLLEKGHLTLTSRRTSAYPHMAPAFDDMEDDFMDRARKYVGEALEG